MVPQSHLHTHFMLPLFVLCPSSITVQEPNRFPVKSILLLIVLIPPPFALIISLCCLCCNCVFLFYSEATPHVVYILFYKKYNNNGTIYLIQTKTGIESRLRPFLCHSSSSAGIASISRLRAVSASSPCIGLFGVTTTSATSLYPYQFLARKIAVGGEIFPHCM